MERQFKLAIATVSVLLAILCIIFLARKYLDETNISSAQTISSNIVSLNDDGLYQSEKLNVSADGEIGQIMVTSEDVLDQNGNSMIGKGFNTKALIGTIALLFVMLDMCIVIARKNNIDIKHDAYEMEEKSMLHYKKA